METQTPYQIARCLQGWARDVQRVHFWILQERGRSLGTGPLDLQMAKKDELGETESGLTTGTALTALRTEAFAAFEEFFLSISASTHGRITVHTASEIAAKLTEGIFAPITGQLDPLRMGEALRSMAIGKEHGIRLMAKSRNLEMDSLKRMVGEYPSHGFVIDGREARTH